MTFCVLSVAFSLYSCKNAEKGGKSRQNLPEEGLVTDSDTVFRAEGSATGADIEIATEMARLNAMTVLAGKIADVDSVVTELSDSLKKVTTSVSAPMYDVIMADRRIYKNKDGSYSVWVLLEMKK